MTYGVGPGLTKRLAQYADQAASDEIFTVNRAGRNQWSEVVGASGRVYRYVFSTNEVHVFDPASSIASGGGPDPAPAAIPPTVIDTIPGVASGTFPLTPGGVILHATRSGQDYTTAQEFSATLNYVRSGAAGLGWNVTVGEKTIATHISPRAWGWNAREASNAYLSAEFAQAKLGGPISDGQVSAFVWWFRNVARAVWPNLPAEFPNHSELPAGRRDGKTDPEPDGQHSLRDRILAALG